MKVHFKPEDVRTIIRETAKKVPAAANLSSVQISESVEDVISTL